MGQLSFKELFMMLLGLGLIASLYYLKISPDLFTQPVATLPVELTETVEVESKPISLPATVIEQVKIPDWLENKNDYDLVGLTVDDLWQFAQTAHQQDHDFFPEQQNALFYLLQAQKAGLDTEESQVMMTTLEARLYAAAEEAATNYQTQRLTDLTARLKTINPDDEKIQQYTTKIGTFYTLEKLSKQAAQQLSEGLFSAQNQQDLVHTLIAAEQIDNNHPEIKRIKNLAIMDLTEQAFRSADENDYEIAESQLAIAQTIDSAHPETLATVDAIYQQKQDRFTYLDNQFYLAIDQLNLARAKNLLAELSALNIQSDQINGYQALYNKTQTYGRLNPLDPTQDYLANGQLGPELVVIPVGSFTMGDRQGPSHQKPAHQVTITKAFAIGKTEISVAQFAQFINSTQYITTAEEKNISQIYDPRSGRFKAKHGINWRHDYQGKNADQDLPVIHVSVNDALAYAAWLAKQTGAAYRLPSENEFEYVLGMGHDYRYPWGNSDPVQVMGNFSGAKDKLNKSRIRWREGFTEYQDGFWGPAPTAHFLPNLYGLNDLSGNVMEWVADCWHDSYVRAPSDNTAWINAGCEERVIRGGHWASSKSDYRIQHRIKAKQDFTDPRLGFRIAKDILVK
ncbi:formylglycine-generating enzyme family protein [Marinicella rhabdoformis]|uniref:formylglycine-generating enzyme family protein n=1 Tax=Marinicella rhabdoformis TaxID=2580566 RepID=UPI0012AED000|nr:formylglycine-generating enzyme family protein [Marinicella rhabdoformis]